MGVVGALVFGPSVERWRTTIEPRAKTAGLPVDFVLAWIKHESGGNVCSLGIPGKEAGLFQTYHPADDRFGATFAELRAACSGTTLVRQLTDAERALQADVGIRYLVDRRNRARAALADVGASWTEGASDFWMLVKLHHALPAFFKFLPAYKHAKGRAPSSWREFREWTEALSVDAFVAASPAAAPWSSSAQRARIFNNAESVGKYGGVEKLGPSTVMLVGLLALAAVAWSMTS